MLKHELRKKYKTLRSQLQASTIAEGSLQLANRALQLPIWEALYFHIFLGAVEHREVDTLPLITLLQGRDKHVVVPKISGANDMESYLLTDSTVLKKNKWHIPEPVNGIPIPGNAIDVVFLPLLAFDVAGNRVGYGKGHYDTFLHTCGENTLKIGLSLFEAEAAYITDTWENDVKLTHCLTPEKVYTF